MAAGHLKVSSSNTSNKSAIFADFYEINKHQDRRYLSYDGKRFRWAGNLESLKHFVENGVKLLGIWTSPGGSSKMFTCSYLDLTVTWYPGKQNTLMLKGTTSLELADTLIEVCSTSISGISAKDSKTSNGDNITLESTSQVPMEKAKQKHENETFSVEQDEVRSTSISSTILQGSTTNCRCNLLAADIEGIKLDMVIMQMQIESNNVSQNRVLNKLGERDEISCLKQDLHKERERSKELEKDMIILVEGRNREVEELNNTIASLQNTLESTEMTNKCLRKEITQINSNNLLKANRNASTQCRLDRPELINHRSNRGNRSTQQYSSHTDHKAIRNNRKNQGEIKLNNATKPSPRVVNPKESSPDANNKCTEEVINTVIKPKSRAHEQIRPDWVHKLPLIDDPKQFDSSPKCNTIKKAKEHVPEANQLTFTRINQLPLSITILK